MKQKIAEIEAPQCPECGYWNVRQKRKRYVDFYGLPVVWHCECGWEKEIPELLRQRNGKRKAEINK